MFQFRDGGGYEEDKEDKVEQEGSENTCGVTNDEIETWMKENVCKGCIDNHPSQKYHITSKENKWGCI